jgi:hypothetical protein
MDASRLVTIASFGSVEEADLARMVLDEEGIPAVLEGQVVVGLLWYLTNATGGVKLQVFEDDASRAREVLARPAAGGEAEEPRTTPTACAQCGAEIEAGFEACWFCGAPVDQEASPAAPPPTPEEPDSEETIDTEEGDAIATRAWHAAVLSFFVCPPLLNIYSVWLLLRLSLTDKPLSDAGRRRFHWAIAMNVATCAVIGIILSRIGRG